LNTIRSAGFQVTAAEFLPFYCITRDKMNFTTACLYSHTNSVTRFTLR
jgi:hypothetical protein